MKISPALQRGLPNSEPSISGHSPDPDDAIDRDSEIPREDIVSRLLAGTLPIDFDRAKLLLVAQAAIGWLARDVRPRVVINPRRQVLWSNAAAAAMLVSPQPLVLHEERVELSKSIPSEPFEHYLATLGSSPARFLLNDPVAERGMLVTGWLLEQPESAPAIFLEFTLRELPLDARSSGLAAQFGLTKSESTIVDLLALMEPPKAIADRLGVSVNTIRTHIRRIYDKLDISTQAQLMRTVMAYCGG